MTGLPSFDKFGCTCLDWAPWAEWCYSRHSRLLFHGDVLTSDAGVQQGDPLGPLLFALALQPAMQAAQAGPLNQSPHLIFAGRCLLSCDYRAVAAGYARLAAAARQVGPHINLAKSETDPMWWAGLGHRSRSLPAWYCNQPHHLLHVVGGAN